MDGKGMKNWHKRFFCLYSSKIFEYYKTEGGEKKGVINLEDCTSVNSGLQHKKYQYIFDIETTDRTYYLVAGSEEEMTDWVETLCKVCEFTSADDVPPPVQPRSLSLQPNSSATMQASHLSSSAPKDFKLIKQRTQSLTAMGTLPEQHPVENAYSLAGQDATYGQPKSAGIPLTDYFEQSGIVQAKKSEGDSRTSVTSNGPPSGIPLSEALSMKGYGTLGQCTIGPAVPPRTPLNEALQIKGFNQMSASEGDSACSTASLAREAEIEVKRMLRQQSFSDVQVKPGTPLNEALAQKGIVNLPRGHGNSNCSIGRSESIPADDPEDHYNVPRNNQPAFLENDRSPPPGYQSPPSRIPKEHHQNPAFFPEDDRSPPNIYQSPRSAIPEGHYQSPRSLMDDAPDQVYNVPPPPRPAPVPRSSPNRKMKSTLLSKSLRDEDSEANSGKVNGTSAPPIIDRSIKPRPPPINRYNKPGRSESFKNDIPQLTEDSVHYVSLRKLKEEQNKPIPRPRTGTKKTDYSEVDLEETLAMGKKFTISEQTPQVPERSRDSLVDAYSSDDDASTGSDISYTKMRPFTIEEADKPDTYYQVPRHAPEEEFDDPHESLPAGL